jgi:integrase
VYLTDLALEIIAKASAETDRLGRHKDSSSSGHLFEAKVGAPISNATLAKAVTRNAKELGIKEVAHWGRWTPHDLRRTMRTGLSACKIRPDIAELAIGHHKQGNLKVYDQHEYEQEIQFAFEAWERRLLSIVSNTQQSDVIALEVVN